MRPLSSRFPEEEWRALGLELSDVPYLTAWAAKWLELGCVLTANAEGTAILVHTADGALIDTQPIDSFKNHKE